MIGIVDSNQKIVTNGLILNLDAAQLRSYPTTGTTWTSLNNGIFGSLVNGAVFNSANGGSIVFDGTNDYVSFGANAIPLSNVSQFTFSGFVKINSSAANGILFSHGVSNGFSTDIVFYYGPPNYLILEINNGVSNGAYIIYTDFLAQWVNICVVYNGSLSTNADKLKLYINSIEQTLNFGTYIVPNTTATLTNPSVNFGRYVQLGSLFLNGNIATTTIYNRALTDAEVGQNYNAIKSRFGL